MHLKRLCSEGTVWITVDDAAPSEALSFATIGLTPNVRDADSPVGYCIRGSGVRFPLSLVPANRDSEAEVRS